MEAFRNLRAIAAPIDERNLDTNQLCPTHLNKIPRTDPDYQRILFNYQRFHPDGSENREFILNREPYCRARLLVADENFGCGSSRESAVYALWAFGIRCVIAPSFGDIFYNNCLKNGLLPIRLSCEVCDRMRAMLGEQSGAEVAVDLERQTVTGPDGVDHPFDIQVRARRAMLQGLDEVGLTLEHRGEIEVFENAYRPTMPWIYAGSDADSD